MIEQNLTAIILAGGLGTRLRPVISDVPKCMADINGKPFLFYVIDHLKREGIRKFIFSLGYKHEQITEYIEAHFPEAEFSIEEEPLGTGGAILKSCELIKGNDALVLNGDTLFKVDVKRMASFHNLSGAECTLALKPMENFSRYGIVELNSDYSIRSFREKQPFASGLINGGVYCINTSQFMKEDLPEKFSFETDFLEKYYLERRIYGLVQDSYFIDIGIPEDYNRAQKELCNE